MKVLVDTSVWIDHLRYGVPELVSALDERSVLVHPFIIGELALGDLRQRHAILGSLHDLPEALVAREDEVLALIDRQHLSGSGIGYVDAHLLAATRLTAGSLLWTRDKRLDAVAQRLGIGMHA